VLTACGGRDLRQCAMGLLKNVVAYVEHESQARMLYDSRLVLYLCLCIPVCLSASFCTFLTCISTCVCNNGCSRSTSSAHRALESNQHCYCSIDTPARHLLHPIVHRTRDCWQAVQGCHHLCKIRILLLPEASHRRQHRQSTRCSREFLQDSGRDLRCHTFQTTPWKGRYVGYGCCSTSSST
jgi:hypothetical protein